MLQYEKNYFKNYTTIVLRKFIGYMMTDDSSVELSLFFLTSDKLSDAHFLLRGSRILFSEPSCKKHARKAGLQESHERLGKAKAKSQECENREKDSASSWQRLNKITTLTLLGWLP